MTTSSVFIVGAGRLGSALARSLVESGWKVAGYARSARGRARLRRMKVPHRPLGDAGSFDLVYLAVPDSQVATVAREVSPHLVRGQVVAHCAGALSLGPLAPARRLGAHVGSLHPMQAFAGGRVTPGVVAAIDGDRAALRVLSRVASDLGLKTVRVPERGRVLYHAASVIASNLCMALADLAVATWAASGAPRGRAVEALVPLMRGAIENLAKRGLPGALTGPASRGDAEVVGRQLRALHGDAAEVYGLLSRRLVELAERGGLDARRAAQVRRVLRRRQGRPAAR